MNNKLHILLVVGLLNMLGYVGHMRGAIAHFSLVYYNPELSGWEVFLGRNIGTAIWSDFHTTYTHNAAVLIKEALEEQTGGLYNQKNIVITGIKPVTLYDDHHFFVVPVKQRFEGRDLRRARNRYKTEFTWIPAKDLIGNDQIVKTPIKRKPERITVDPSYRAVFRKILPDQLKKLEEACKINQKAPAKKHK